MARRMIIIMFVSFVTNHCSGQNRAVSSVCVCVCVNNSLWTKWSVT